MRLAEWPPARTLLVAGYPDHFAAADDLMGILAHRPHNLSLTALGVLLAVFAVPFLALGCGFIVPGTG